jgi:hypothetical protein
VKLEEMTERDSILRWHQRREVGLDLVGVGVLREAEPLGEAQDVGVHADGGPGKGVAEDDVGGLATDAGQGEEAVQIARNITGTFLDEHRGGGADRLGLVPVEVDTADVVLVECGPGGGGAVLLEEAGGDGVDEVVAGLGGEDEGDEQFERRREIQREPGIGVRFAERGDDSLDRWLAQGFWRAWRAC